MRSIEPIEDREYKIFKTLVDVLQFRASINPDFLVFRFLKESDESETINFASLAQRAQAIAATLQEKGIKKSDRVILIYPPGIELIVAMFGCFYAGVIAVPVYPPSHLKLVEKLQHIITDCEPVAILLTSEILQQIKKLKILRLASKIPVIKKLTSKYYKNTASMTKWDSNSVFIKTNKISPLKATKWHPVTLSSDYPAYLQYTSGSTGDPKGVIVTHKNILHNSSLIYQSFNNKKESVYVIWLPPYHDMGLIAGIIQPIFGGFPCILMSPLQFLKNPLIWLKTISQYHGTASTAPNFAYDLCVKKITSEQKEELDLSTWNVAANGAEPIHKDTFERFYNYFKDCNFREEAFQPCYGLAEACLVVSAADYFKKYEVIYISSKALKQHKLEIVDQANPDAQAIVNVGPPLLEVKIVHPKSHHECTKNEIGEIWVSGDSVAKGYWKKSEQTKHTFKAHIIGDKNKTSYLRTGDLGFIHEGNLYVTGRKSDLIIIHGQNYYPQDIEFVVSHSHIKIRPGNSAAFSILSDEEENLAIVCEVENELDQNTYQDIFKSIRQAVSKHHELNVKMIALIPPKTLPKTTSGKIRRQASRKALLEGKLTTYSIYNVSNGIDRKEPKKIIHLKSSDEITETIVANYVHALLANLLEIPVDDLKSNALLNELGLDSLKIIELSNHLNEKFDFDLPDTFLSANKSVEDITKSLYHHLQSKPNNKYIHSKILSSHFLQEPSVITHNKVILSPKEISRMDTFTNLPEWEELYKSKQLLKKFSAENMFFNVIENISTNKIITGNREYINYSSYNYLGLSGNAEVTQSACEAINKYGTSVSASRLVSGQKPIHIELEKIISNLIGTENSLVFSSGYGTNVAIITAIFNSDDLILYDELSHNSLVQAAQYSGAKRLSFKHNNCNALQQLLETHRKFHKKTLIITEGVFSMDGDIAPLPELVALKKRYHAFLMVDEAHSMGVIGSTGKGIREYFNLPPTDVDIWMGTLSKAFASCGGYVSGSNDLIEYLKYRSNLFIFSAGISPPDTAAALKAIEVMLKNPQLVADLQSRSNLFLFLLKNFDVNVGQSEGTPIIPIIIGKSEDALKLSMNLKAKGIYALPIIYPAVDENACRVRFFINCLHSEEEIKYTAEVASFEYHKIKQRR